MTPDPTSRQGAGSPRRTPSGRRANDLDGKEWLKNSISIWSDVHKTPEEKALRHPATFPTQLAARLIETFTNADQKVVLDPFSGTGSSAVAAETMGKLGIGADISPEYTARARERPLPQPSIISGASGTTLPGTRLLIEADAKDLARYVDPESVDLVVTSPPYWDILLRKRTADYKETRHYGESDRDLGRIPDYQDFLDALANVFGQVLTALKPGSYCCVIVMDLRKKNVFFPLHADLAATMLQLGFLLDDIIIWDRRQEYNNLRPLGYPSVFRINRVHEYVLIFQKPRSVTT